MNPEDLSEWIKSLLIAIVAIIIAWEKVKRWRFKRNGKDRRNPNPHVDVAYELGKLSQSLKDHEKHDDQRTGEIKATLRHLGEEQGRHTVSIELLKARVNSR